LHLEDDANDEELVHRALKSAGFVPEIKVVRARDEYLAAMEATAFDVILSDNKVAGFDGSLALEAARDKRPGVPFIFVSGFANREQALEKLQRSGATDCVSKSDLHLLADSITKAVRENQVRTTSSPSEWDVRALERLVSVVQELFLARDMDRILSIVRRAARELTGADGATFVLREGELCHYADEDAIAPLWKGRRFPIGNCISGWVMLNRQAVVIEDIYADARIPADAYRPTFVKTLVMVPIRTADPVGAIGNYWATRRQPRPEEVKLLQALADSTSVAMKNVQLYADLERKVADRTARLQALNEEMEAFSHSISHDLQAPLRHIDAYTQILRDEAADTLTPANRRHLAIINDAARKLGSLIEDLLELSRMGRAELRRRRVNVRELITEVLGGMAQETQDRDISWDIGDLPEVEGDLAMLKQVWMNLLSNAIKYTRHRERAEIRIGAALHSDEAEFFVQDNGAGFDMKFADKLFGLFQRLHSPDDFEGSGVGLANVRRIVTRHGGRTWANGEEGVGATFFFTLPRPAENNW
jgi:signal transduction histidine kinase